MKKVAMILLLGLLVGSLAGFAVPRSPILAQFGFVGPMTSGGACITPSLGLDNTTTVGRFGWCPGGNGWTFAVSPTSTDTLTNKSIAASEVNSGVLAPARGALPVFNAAGTAQTTSTLHVVSDTCTLGTNCAVTFAGSAVFADTSYVCSVQDQTAAAATKFVATSASVATFTGTGTDVLVFTCIGK